MNQLSLKTPIVVVGLGKSGTAALQFLIACGYIHKQSVFTFDEKAISDFNKWSDLDNLPVGTLIVSPGVSLALPSLIKLKTAGWQVTSEINLASSVLTNEKIIGVTGSVGKSTVTSLLGEGALNEDPNAFVGGNLGTPFCEYALRILKQPLQKANWIVLELSSYQLENCEKLNLDFSAITYLSANHLERYASLDEYYLTKCKIGGLTKHVCIINTKSPDLVKYSAHIKSKIIFTSEKISDLNIGLIGNHNKENYLVALALAQAAGWSKQSCEKMAEFKGLPHRLEKVGPFGGITFINDSKATAMDSVLVAVMGAVELTSEKNFVYVLLGGKDKNLPWEDLATLKKYKNLIPVFFGQCGELAQKKSTLLGKYFNFLGPAIQHCLTIASPNDIVLLSPGGTSLDEFKNFEHRGEFFKNFILNYYSKK